jgi:hypothetical protein
MRGRSLLWAGPGVLLLGAGGGEPDPLTVATEDLNLEDLGPDDPRAPMAAALPVSGPHGGPRQAPAPPPANRDERSK